jgi:hypothetical protein
MVNGQPPSPDARPAPARLLEFIRERFLPIPQLVMIVTLTWFGMESGALAPTGTGTSTFTGVPAAAIGLLTAIIFFFRLRVFDDVKDAAYDREHELSRPIPRGLVREQELNSLAGFMLVTEALLVLPLELPVVITWALAAGWTLLMRVEFFCGEWLEEHTTTYAVTHMASMIPFTAFVATVGRAAYERPAATTSEAFSPFLGLACVWVATFVLGMGFELGRKFDRYHAALQGWAWAIWALTPAVGGVLTAYGIHRLGADHSSVLTMVVLSGIFAVLGLLALRSVLEQGRAAAATLVEMTPSVLGLLVLLAGAILMTLDVPQ